MLQANEAKAFSSNSHHIKDRYPFSPYPEGWFAVAWEDDIEANEIYREKVCGENIIVFRTKSNDVKVLDAYCPHLGANLGYGGVLEDDTVKCPFHGWRFDCTGKCVDVPHTEKPMKAKIRSWVTRVVNGMVMVWFSANNSAPTWEIDEINLVEWTKPILDEQCIWVLKTHVQEIAENGVDTAHFPTVHGASAPGKLIGTKYDWPKASWRSESESVVDGKTITAIADVSLQGLGLQQVNASMGKKGQSIRTFLHVTPLDEEHVIIRMPVSIQSSGNQRKDDFLLKLAIPQVAKELSRDFDIWENKRYLTRPLLSRADGSIHEFRKWAKNFYSNQHLIPIENSVT